MATEEEDLLRPAVVTAKGEETDVVVVRDDETIPKASAAVADDVRRARR